VPEFFVGMGPLEVFTMLATIIALPISIGMMVREVRRLLSAKAE
jgi:hypothetical protein